MKLAYRNKIPVAAHRGNSRYFPENTLCAFRSAIELGVDMVEFDLHMTKDGVLIVMHDHMVDRTTDGTGLIREKTLAEIKALDAGSWKGEA
ncbi:MAG: glycerophosphodiester phosphodiesterase, partial [Lachnospiraceae bacterium]|nr:glycerophosphodiester phosphodiesterase [Lachnospiraceae bacterium]